MRRAVLVLMLGAAFVVLPGVRGERTQPPALVAFAEAWAGISGYSATVTFFEQKNTQVQNMVLNYIFSKPANATMSFTQGPYAGITLAWNGGATMTAHWGTGFFALFKETVSLHDPRAMTIRGSSISELSFRAILAHAQDTPGIVSEGPGPVIDGTPTEAVQLIPTTPPTDTDLTLEVVDLSTATHFPMRVLGYQGGTLVRTISFSNVKLER